MQELEFGPHKSRFLYNLMTDYNVCTHTHKCWMSLNCSLKYFSWHSWSPVPMNGQDESSMVPLPLYPDATNNSSPKTGLAGVETAVVVATQSNTNSSSQQNQYQHQHHHNLPPYSSPVGGGHGHTYTTSGRWLDFIPVSTPTPTTSSSGGLSSSNRHNGHINSHHAHSGTSSNGDLQTPTPFYTPNEPSPKFMNSPVFSYSNPDTALYQGPFSPMRASSLYPPPNSPFTNLSLNSPLLPLSGGSSTSSSGGGSGGGNQNSISTPISSSSSSSSGSNNCFNMIPSTLLSPAPSQASTNSLSYEDLHEKSLNFFQPAWSIFMAGTKVSKDKKMDFAYTLFLKKLYFSSWDKDSFRNGDEFNGLVSSRLFGTKWGITGTQGRICATWTRSQEGEKNFFCSLFNQSSFHKFLSTS